MSDLLPPIAPVSPFAKVVVRSTDINLSFLLASDLGASYKIVYVVNIITRKQRLEPNVRLSPSKIDMPSLKRAIEGSIDLYDKQYMNLVKFDNVRAEFHFDHKKWLKDCLANVNPVTQYSRFSRTFKFKKRVPAMIRHGYTSVPFELFIIRKFKEYLEENHQAANWFQYLFPDEMRQRARKKISRMFDYSYDSQWNTMIIRLKTLYILGILYAVGIMAKKMTQSDIQSSYKRGLFAQDVKKNIKKFDREKWDKFMSRGFL